MSDVVVPGTDSTTESSTTVPGVSQTSNAQNTSTQSSNFSTDVQISLLPPNCQAQNGVNYTAQAIAVIVYGSITVIALIVSLVFGLTKHGAGGQNKYNVLGVFVAALFSPLYFLLYLPITRSMNLYAVEAPL
jgi:hypothetical protein